MGPVFFDAIEKVEPGRIIAQGVNDYPASVSSSASCAKDLLATLLTNQRFMNFSLADPRLVLNTWPLWSPLQHLNARNQRSSFPVTGEIYTHPLNTQARNIYMYILMFNTNTAKEHKSLTWLPNTSPKISTQRLLRSFSLETQMMAMPSPAL